MPPLFSRLPYCCHWQGAPHHLHVPRDRRAHHGGVHGACTLPTLRPQRCDVESMTKCNGHNAGQWKLCGHLFAGAWVCLLPRPFHFEPSSLHWLVHQYPFQPSIVHTASRLGEDYPATGFTRILLWTALLEVVIGTGCWMRAPPLRSSRLLVWSTHSFPALKQFAMKGHSLHSVSANGETLARVFRSLALVHFNVVRLHTPTTPSFYIGKEQVHATSKRCTLLFMEVLSRRGQPSKSGLRS